MPILSSFGGGSIRGFNPGSSGPHPVGEAQFLTTGTHTWTVPAGVTTISIVAIGGGGTAGNHPNAQDGQPGLDSYVEYGSTKILTGGGGGRGKFSTPRPNNAGIGAINNTTLITGNYAAYNGGDASDHATNASSGDGGGAGAAGYSGNGGNVTGNTGGIGGNPQTGSGGGGGASSYAAGGGVGIFGRGADGSYAPSPSPGQAGYAFGTGGSGGQDGTGYLNSNNTGFDGGNYGGGGGTYWSAPSGGGGGGLAWANQVDISGYSQLTVRVGAGGTPPNRGPNGPGEPGNGAVRIIWGDDRSFPTTNVALADSDGNVSTY